MKKITTTILLFLMGISNTCLFSQIIQLTVESVKETRSTVDRENMIDFKVNIKGVEIDENNLVKVYEYTDVYDDQGLQLFQKEGVFSRADKYQSRNILNLTFDTPSRSATMISSINGIMEYFTPTKMNGGKIIIEKPLSKINTRIFEDSNSNIAIDLTDKQSLEEYNEKYKKNVIGTIDSLTNENKIGAELKEKSNDVIAAFEGLFSGFNSFMSKDNGFYFKINGPKENVVDIRVYNENGKIVSNGVSTYNSIIIKTFNDIPNDNWTLEIVIRSKEAIKLIPFSLKNVKLP